MQSVGSNVPNLMYRESIIENLEWMRTHRVRWIRVFVTGHREQVELTRDLAEQRLRELVRLVEAYNASIPRNEAIFLMVVLTDYYSRGVPGDIYVRDNPEGCEYYVLPAPWFRRGWPYFDFQPDCDDGKRFGMANYEAHFKPFVQQITGALADTNVIMGWQIGNELKARRNPTNGISGEEAHGWYLDFVNDIVDSIRAVNRNHLIITPDQHFAESADLPYRPEYGDFEPYLRSLYFKDFDRALQSCGQHCWNIWNITYYDFTPYALDDAMILARAKVATVATEFGFTLGNGWENNVRFGGDRVEALRSGMRRGWQDIFGRRHESHWGLLEATQRLDLDGVAAWGSTNPDPNTDPGADLDRRRGISHAPEGEAMWGQWTRVASELEFNNSRAGVVHNCTKLNSSGRPNVLPDTRRSTSAMPTLLSRTSAAPAPPLDFLASVVGISTSEDDPSIVLRTRSKEWTVRLPRTQVVKTYNLADVVRVRGWPMGDDVMWATLLEQAPGRRPS